MSSKSRKATQTQERRTGTKSLVEKLTGERAEMLTLFCRVAGLEPFKDDNPDKQSPALLQEFCQVLVDYIAAGHFSLYERIENEAERRQAAAQLAENLYPRIAQTTEAALTFNDKYDTEEKRDIPSELEKDLSRLGEELALRIELEDRLLKALMSPRETETKPSVSAR
ncbi:MAG: sigma D regulator [Acidiferrobacterales bacterium]